MSQTRPCFLRSLIPCISLLLIFSSSSRYAEARQLQQFDSSAKQDNQLTMPEWSRPSLDKPAAPLTFPAFQEPVIPPHFFPMLPFPGMPSIPSLPTGPTFPGFPAGPSNPSLPTAPTLPGMLGGVPPAFPVPTESSGKLTGTQTSP